ncbi:MAG TPA: DUF2167 domain-containing protein [Rhizobacter sp.]|nr:DUF2167 domain-containing protein [Rhizobacter sp.]
MFSIRSAFALASLCALSLSSPASAADAAMPTLNPEHGPKTIALADQGSLKLPAGYVYLNEQDAGAMLTYWGNPGPHKLLGMVLSEEDKANWAVSLRFRKEGYVKDEDAKTWNADDLFTSVKEGTEASNEERKKMGGGELHIVDWVQKPTYDAATHRLAWGMRAEAIDGAQRTETVNYHTYVLGREGFIEMNLMTEPQALGGVKPRADELLGATTFADGKRYEDFSSATDHVAEYGLAALIAGGVAKKLGLLATLGLLLAKFWKVALIGLAVFGGGVAKLFKRSKA